MKKSVLFVMALVTAAISFSIFPIKESSAVRAYEFWGTTTVVPCTAKVETSSSWNVSVTVTSGSVTGSAGGSSGYAYVSGTETKCEGFNGLCDGTNCTPAPQ